MTLFLLTGVILSLLVLIQRGRGGGLAGAFGGPGGHSAFGTKTADVFTKATAVVGGIFFVLSVVTALYMRSGKEETKPTSTSSEQPAGGTETPAPATGGAPSTPGGESKAAPTGGAAPAPAGGAAPAESKPAGQPK